MSTNSDEYKYVLYILEFISFERKDLKPNSNYFYKEKGPLETSFQEKLRHTMTVTSFDNKYLQWFQNKEKHFKNFQILLHLEFKEYIRRGCNDEEFLNYRITIGTLARFGELDCICGALNYAVTIIMFTLENFRKKRQSLPDVILSFMKCQNEEKVENNSDSGQNHDSSSSMNTLMDALKPKMRRDSSHSSRISNGSSNSLKGVQGSDNVSESRICKESQNVDRVSQNKPNYFSMIKSEDKPRNKLEIKESSIQDVDDINTCLRYSAFNFGKFEALLMDSERDHFALKLVPLPKPLTESTAEITEEYLESNGLSLDIKSLCDETLSKCDKSINVTRNFNEPSTSGAFPKLFLQPLRQFSDLTSLNIENFQEDILPLRNETVKCKKFNDIYFHEESLNQSSCEFQNESDIFGESKTYLERNFADFEDEKLNIDSLTPVKIISPKRRSLPVKTKLNELYSEKLKTSPNHKPKRIKKCE